MFGARLFGLVLATAVVGCGAAEHQYVRPWFRMTTSPKHVIAPHAIEWGGVRRPEILVDGDWRELDHSDFAVHDIGDAIAVDEYTFVDPRRTDAMNDRREHGASGVFIYREGHADAIHIPPERCATPRYSDAPAEIACFGCGTREPYTRLPGSLRGEEPCSTMHLDTFDARGRAISRLAFVSPVVQPDVEGRVPNGPWIIVEERMRHDFLMMGAPRMRFALDAAGLRALPFGADPLVVEIGAEQRAEEILREIPIRDAAVAALRESFAEDEHAHPGWVVRAEVLNQLRPNQAMEPEAPAEPGTCYTLVARASPGLTRVEVSVHSKSPYVPLPIEEVHDGVLAFATGAPLVTLSRCVAPGDPAVYHWRVGSRGGTGYVLARVYSHPPEP